MAEEISAQMLVHASENVQKLFDLSTRIDERVKLIQEQRESTERRIEEIMRRHLEIMQKIAVLESKNQSEVVLAKQFGELEGQFTEIDKRLMVVEGTHGRNTDRWNKIAAFLIQLVWVILAAYLLTKLHLQAPAVP